MTGKEFIRHKKTGTNRLPFSYNPECGLHVFDDCVAKFATFQQLSAIHQTFEVIGYGFRVDCAFHTFNDKVSRFNPTHMAQQ